MRKDEFDKINHSMPVPKHCCGWTPTQCFELINGPLDGQQGVRSLLGIGIFGRLITYLEDGKPLQGHMGMPEHFKAPSFENVLVYRYKGNMRYEFEGYV